MKNAKIFEVERHLTEAIATNPPRSLYLHLRKAKKVVSKITEKLNDDNPLPPTFEAYQRELGSKANEFNSSDQYRKKEILDELAEKHPLALADVLAFENERARISKLDSDVVFQIADGSLAWKDEKCLIPIDAYDALVDVGVFSEE